MDSCVKNQNKTSCESEVHENCSLGKEMTPDLVVRVSGRDFCCNKKQMMGSSEFFRGMFESEMKEANSDCVQIEEADIETMAAVIRFCETGRLELSVDNVHQVAELASKYQVSNLIGKCSIFLRDFIHDENCFSTLFFADTFYLKEAYSKARHYVLWNFMKLLHQGEFIEMETSQLRRIISDPKLNVKSELETLKALMCWINHDMERTGSLPELLMDVLEFCNEKDIEMIMESPDVSKNCKDLLSDLGGEKSRNCSKKKRFIPHHLISVGVHIEDDDISGETDSQDLPRQIVSYDVDTGHITPFTKVPDGCLISHDTLLAKKGYSVCTQGEKIFVSGGEDRLGKNTWMMQIWCYNNFEKSWSTVAELRNPRRHHAMCVSGDSSLLLMGGFGRFRYRLDSVQEYDYHTDEWSDRAPMPEKMVNICACRCHNYVFVVKTGSISSPLSYNTALDQWTCLSFNTTLGELAFDAKRIWMIPDSNFIFIGMDNVHTVFKINIITNEMQECSVVSDNGRIRQPSYDVSKLDPEKFSEHCEVIKALKNVYHLDANLEKDKLCKLFSFFVRNEILAVPSFPGLIDVK